MYGTQVLAQDDTWIQGASMLGFIGFAVGVVALVVLFVAALISVLRSPRYATGGKVVWILVTFAFPVIGPVCWFIWGRSSSIRPTPYDR